MDIYELINTLNFSNIIWQILAPIIFSFADIVTGYIQAMINHDVDSQKMRTGLLHKMLIIIVIILSFVIQLTFNIDYISSFVCIYVILMELVSICENLQKAGVDIGRLGDFLKDKTENNEDEEE